MKGKLEKISEITSLQNGTGKNGAWTLWGCSITVNGKKYGITDFQKTILTKKVEKLKTGSTIEFETEQNGDYINLKRKTEIKILEEGSGKAGPTPDVPKLTDKELENMWKETADFMDDYWKEKKMDVSVDMIGPSINTIYMAKLKVRGIR